MWGVLTGQHSDSTPSLVLHEVREIQTWMLRLLSAPVPVPGRTRVEVSTLLIISSAVTFTSAEVVIWFIPLSVHHLTPSWARFGDKKSE